MSAAVSMFLPTGRRLRNGLADSGERSLRPEDITEVMGIPVTTMVRTAWDLGRVRSTRTIAQRDGPDASSARLPGPTSSWPASSGFEGSAGSPPCGSLLPWPTVAPSHHRSRSCVSTGSTPDSRGLSPSSRSGSTACSSPARHRQPRDPATRSSTTASSGTAPPSSGCTTATVARPSVRRGLRRSTSPSEARLRTSARRRGPTHEGRRERQQPHARLPLARADPSLPDTSNDGSTHADRRYPTRVTTGRRTAEPSLLVTSNDGSASVLAELEEDDAGDDEERCRGPWCG